MGVVYRRLNWVDILVPEVHPRLVIPDILLLRVSQLDQRRLCGRRTTTGGGGCPVHFCLGRTRRGTASRRVNLLVYDGSGGRRRLHGWGVRRVLPHRDEVDLLVLVLVDLLRLRRRRLLLRLLVVDVVLGEGDGGRPAGGVVVDVVRARVNKLVGMWLGLCLCLCMLLLQLLLLLLLLLLCLLH